MGKFELAEDGKSSSVSEVVEKGEMR